MQTRQKRIIEAQSGHEVDGQDILGFFSAHRETRQIQARLLRNVYSNPGFSIEGKSICIIGPGEGFEAIAIAKVGGIDLGEKIGSGRKQIHATVVEMSLKRASALVDNFHGALSLVTPENPDGNVYIRPFSEVNFPENALLIQAGFVWNDLKDEEKELLLKKSLRSLQVGGALVIADGFFTNPNKGVKELPQEDPRRIAIEKELDAYYELIETDLAKAQQHGLISERIVLQSTIEAVRKAKQDAKEGKDGRESFDSPESMKAKISKAIHGESGKFEVHYYPVKNHGVNGNFGGVFVAIKR